MATALTSKHKLYLTAAGVVLLALVLSAEKDSRASGNEVDDSSGVPCRMVVTADVLNVRAEPDRRATIVGTLAKDQEVVAEKKKDNGFRMLSEGRWAYDKYLDEGDRADC